MSIKVIDRDQKANFEIRVTNKETNKSKIVSIYAEDETEETLKDKIKYSSRSASQSLSCSMSSLIHHCHVSIWRARSVS